MIIGACVVYNNCHVFNKTLESFNALCDELVVIDDGSTECTADERHKVIESLFKKPFIFNKIEKTEKEIQRRSQLWENICSIGNENDWIVLLDSDECYFEKSIPRLLKLMNDNHINDNIVYIASSLFNMWTETEYRVDGYWNPKFEMKRRIFKLKKDVYKPQNFTEATVECGEVPGYVFRSSGIVTDCKLLHLGYIKEEDRLRKYNWHKQIDPEGKFHLSSHINSIIETPVLEELK
jgi:glycosyltransferase involved in cell wall biosynthesis